jgi:hypothetical protein
MCQSKEGEKLNKEMVLITPDVIEDCLRESLDAPERNTLLRSKKETSSKASPK